jgi:erythronate-4-phosphate dehydrogenase
MKRRLKIVADENICGLQSFERFAEVTRLPGRQINPASLQGVDALLVRSVTQVNEPLLQHSRLRFVGTATSGFDHIDLNYLRQCGIHFAYAPGSNAHAVVQYVFATLAQLMSKAQGDLRKLSLGIVGGGHIGSLLAEYCLRLEMQFVIHDPFLNEQYRFSQYLVSFDEALKQDVLTLHASLDRNGPHPSFHLLNEKTLQQLPANTWLINASRGSVIDGDALLKFFQGRDKAACVLDVWEDEPHIDIELLQAVSLGTPHIAGYSLEGKEQGSAVLYRALLDCFELPSQPDFPLDQGRTLLQAPQTEHAIEQVNQTILAAYDIQRDSQALKELNAAADLAGTFEHLRKNYPLRREFSHYQIKVEDYEEAALQTLLALGFSQAWE